ncbi:MAG: hypothetical protein IV086_05555 [Hyphomonadaceae bacterium]|nr:hypothetical protein [Hyphomonadaceae bacterium]
MSALWRDLVGARVLLLLGAGLLAALIALTFEPTRDAGTVHGRVTGFNQLESKYPRPVRLLSVKLDDGKLVWVRAPNGVLPAPNARVRLVRHEHLGLWRRTTFQFEAYEPYNGQ